jgi:hypothetical protein
MGGAAPGAEGRNMDHLCLRAEPFDREAIIAYLEYHGVRVGDFGVRYGAEGEGPSQYPVRSGRQPGGTEKARRRATMPELRPVSIRRLALLLGGLAMFGPFSIDTIFPAFPESVRSWAPTSWRCSRRSASTCWPMR